MAVVSIISMIKYRFYPTLLNTFSWYLRGDTMSDQDMIAVINRVPTPTTAAQERGISFEEAVVKGTDEDRFDPEILAKVRKLLPRPIVDVQVY
jgi:hypothetical protein